MSRRSSILAWIGVVALAVALAAGTSALGGTASPSAGSPALAAKALKAAKKADKRSRQAAAAAAKPKVPGPQGAKGDTGGKGEPGTAGSPGANGTDGQDAADGSPGKTASNSKTLADDDFDNFDDSITVGSGAPSGAADRRIHALVSMLIQRGDPGSGSCRFALDAGSLSPPQYMTFDRILEEVVLETSWATNSGPAHRLIRLHRRGHRNRQHRAADRVERLGDQPVAELRPVAGERFDQLKD